MSVVLVECPFCSAHSYLKKQKHHICYSCGDGFFVDKAGNAVVQTSGYSIVVLNTYSTRKTQQQDLILELKNKLYKE